MASALAYREDGQDGPEPPPCPARPTVHAAPSLVATAAASGAAHQRYSDRPLSLGARMVGMVGTALVCLALTAAGLLRWAEESRSHVEAGTLKLIEVGPLEAPSAPSGDIATTPADTECEERAIEPALAPKIRLTTAISAIPSTFTSPTGLPGPHNLPAPAPPGIVTPSQPATQMLSTQASPAPSAAKVSNAPANWEGLLMAALHRAKRYPREARRRVQEGTAWIRLTIDRRGRVRSVRLDRSSGINALDREAIALPGRAQPLPRPPVEVRGERIELMVPIEFLIR